MIALGDPPLRTAPAGRVAVDRRPDRRHRRSAGGAPRAPRPAADASGLADERGEVRTTTPPAPRPTHVADLLRRAHLDDGVAWADMAVLVRSGHVDPIAAARAERGGRAGRGGQRRDAAGARTGRAAAAGRPPPVGDRPSTTSTTCREAADRAEALDLPAGWPRRRRGSACSASARGAARDDADPRELARRAVPPGLPRRRGGPDWRRPRRRRRRPASAPPATGSTRPTVPSRCSGAWDGTGLGPPGCATRPSSAASRSGSADRDLDAIVRCSTPLPGRRTQAGDVGAASSSNPVGPADPGRHARRARCRGDGVRLLTAHRARAWSGTSSSSSTCRRRRGPTSVVGARCSAPTDRLGTGRSRPTTVATARRRAAAVLRRGHPSPAAPGGDGRRLARRRRGAAVAVPRTAARG